MSLRAMTWAFSVRGLTSTEKVVLLALADYSNDDGECWPGQVSLAEKCDVSERTIRNTLNSLNEKGRVAIESRRRPDGYKTSNRYLLAMEISPAASAAKPISPAGSGNSHRQTVAGQEPSVEPSGNTPPTPSKDESAFEALWAVWPRKDSRKPALRAWQKLTSTQKSAHLPAIVAHANAYRQNTPPKYIPMLSTFLNQERWDDPLAVDETRGSRTAEPVRPQPFNIPAGHRLIRDDMTGAILGTEPVE